jgi:hypothetical protein
VGNRQWGVEHCCIHHLPPASTVVGAFSRIACGVEFVVRNCHWTRNLGRTRIRRKERTERNGMEHDENRKRLANSKKNDKLINTCLLHRPVQSSPIQSSSIQWSKPKVQQRGTYPGSNFMTGVTYKRRIHVLGGLTSLVGSTLIILGTIKFTLPGTPAIGAEFPHERSLCIDSIPPLGTIVHIIDIIIEILTGRIARNRIHGDFGQSRSSGRSHAGLRRRRHGGTRRTGRTGGTVTGRDRGRKGWRPGGGHRWHIAPKGWSERWNQRKSVQIVAVAFVPFVVRAGSRQWNRHDTHNGYQRQEHQDGLDRSTHTTTTATTAGCHHRQRYFGRVRCGSVRRRYSYLVDSQVIDLVDKGIHGWMTLKRRKSNAMQYNA